MNILFMICGRAGSKGFSNKNLKKLDDVPLVYYTLGAIYGYSSMHPEHNITVAVNTDSEPLKDIINNQKYVPVQFVARKEELAGDVVPKVSVIKDTYCELSKMGFDVIIDLDITSPYRRVIDLEEIIKVYTSGDYDIVFSVVPSRRSPYFNMVEKKEDGYYRKICQSLFTARQQAPQCYELNASIYAYNPQFLDGEINKTILDYRCGISIMPDYLVLDIDSKEDFEMMQYLHGYYCEKEEGLKRVFDIAKGMCCG